MTGMATVTFIGAGSVEFTRELLIDLLSFPELGDLRLSLHDIDPERLETAEAIARDTADQLGASPDDRHQPRPAASPRGRRRTSSTASRSACTHATVRDFEIPAKYGLRQTIGDTLGIGGIFRGLRTFPVLDGIARDMLDVAPDAWLLNYTNPMAMNIAYLAEAHPTLKAVGLCHSVYWTVHDLCRIIDVPLDEVSFAQRRGQPPGLAARLVPRRREPLSAAGQGNRARPRAVAGGCASTCTSGSATSPPRPASTRPSTSRSTSATTRRSNVCGIPVGEYVRISEANLATYAADPGGSRCRDTTSASYARPPSTRRWSSTPWRPVPPGPSSATSPTAA